MKDDINYFENFKSGITNDINSYDSFIEMFCDINYDYTELIKELIHVKPDMGEFRYTAHINALLHDLKLLDNDNFIETKIDNLLSMHNVLEDEFLKWYDLIPQDYNELYEILSMDKYNLNIEEYYGESVQIHNSLDLEPKINVNNLSLYREGIKNVYPILKDFEVDEIKNIQRKFAAFIKNFYYYKLHKYLSSQVSTPLSSDDKNNEAINPYPDIFKKTITYDYFKDYIEKHIVEPHPDYSYLFQRLLHEELIHKLKQKDFMKWLKDEEFIKSNTYNEFLIKNQFYSLGKTGSVNRINNFNNVFNI